MEKNILIADDHDGIVDILSAYVSKEGFHPVKAYDGEEALEKFQLHQPVLVLLDVMMPGKDGFTVCREIRRISNTPVILVTARSEDVDIIMGLDIGADDYIIKPFKPTEVMARIRAILRRVDGTNEMKKESIELPGLTINLEKHEVLLNGKAVKLTQKEIDILWLLASNPGKVFSRENLLGSIWGFDYYGDSRTVDTHVKRLRSKLEDGSVHPWSIDTIWGIGYKLDVTHD